MNAALLALVDTYVRSHEAQVLPAPVVLAGLATGYFSSLTPADERRVRERAFGAESGGFTVAPGAPHRVRETGPDSAVIEVLTRSGWTCEPPRITTACEAWLHDTCEATTGAIMHCRCRCHAGTRRYSR